tara:strand:+ start:275 stop:496 length:222 start_codon:yes stop_codon:yes gene_type:complete
MWWTVSDSRSQYRHLGSFFSIMSRIVRHRRVPLGSRLLPKMSRYLGIVFMLLFHLLLDGRVKEPIIRFIFWRW